MLERLRSTSPNNNIDMKVHSPNLSKDVAIDNKNHFDSERKGREARKPVMLA